MLKYKYFVVIEYYLLFDGMKVNSDMENFLLDC